MHAGIATLDVRLAWVFSPAVLLLLLGMRSPVQAQSSIGSISAFAGQCGVRRGTHSFKLSAGSTIVQGDEISTGIDGGVTVRTNSRNQIELGNSTTLSVTADNRLGSAEIRVNLHSGIARSSIGARGMKMEVITGNADVKADSGTYDTSYYTGAVRPGFGTCAQFTEVAALIDSAEVTNLLSRSPAPTTVPAGYATVVACNTDPLYPAPLNVTGVKTLGHSKIASTAGIAGMLTYFVGPGGAAGELQAVSGTVISPQY